MSESVLPMFSSRSFIVSGRPVIFMLVQALRTIMNSKFKSRKGGETSVMQ